MSRSNIPLIHVGTFIQSKSYSWLIEPPDYIIETLHNCDKFIYACAVVLPVEG